MPNKKAATKKRVPISRVTAEEFFRQGRARRPRHQKVPAWMIANALLGHDPVIAKLARPVYQRAHSRIRDEIRDLTGIDY